MVVSCATIRRMNETRLTQLLKVQGLRLIDLARKLEVDKGTVTRWSIKEVPLGRVFDVERVTGISRQELRPDFFGEDAPEEAAAQ